MIAGRSEILPFLPNAKDHLVVSRLSTAPIGDLSVDRFAELFCKKGKLPSDRDVTNLRLALIQIYLRAATSRMSARASRSQIMSARNASNRLRDAIRLLEDISPARQRGLQGAFGSPFDDPKGLDEHNEFSSASMQIKRDMIPIAMRLDRAIENETGKPFVRGERKKRLRILAEALANWWIATTGKSLAPTVQAKRLDHRPAFVIGRRGGYVDLARGVFSEIDEFSESEVISAVTNVHESGLPKHKSPKK